ncbi:MAG: type II toxin-antitoxin system RelE/ParE family toxin [Oceanicaulis sp.]
MIYERHALKALAKMPSNTANLIRSKVDQLAENPQSLANNIKALKGRPGVFRLRVGDWRVIYRDGVVIAVIRIAPRGAAYE